MKIVADTNIFLAVALNEPERPRLVEVTTDAELSAPNVLYHEVGNALSALVKRRRLSAEEALRSWDVVRTIPVELIVPDLRSALALAVERRIYAYDAYYLACALSTGCPLLTLDRAMQGHARELNIRLLETP